MPRGHRHRGGERCLVSMLGWVQNVRASGGRALPGAAGEAIYLVEVPVLGTRTGIERTYVASAARLHVPNL